MVISIVKIPEKEGEMTCRKGEGHLSFLVAREYVCSEQRSIGYIVHRR